MPATRNAALLADLGRAYDLMQQGSHQEALDAALEVQAAATAANIRSSQVVWLLAALHDLLGKPVQALRLIRQAIEADPLSLSAHKSRDIIARNCRQALASMKPGNGGIPEAYALLLEEGEADGSSHLAQARYLLQAGRPAEAMELLRAVTLLEPHHSPEAWELLAELARSLGRIDLAEEAEVALKTQAAQPSGLSTPAIRPTVEA